MSPKNVTDLAALRADANRDEKYQAYIMRGSVPDLIRDAKGVFHSALSRGDVKHSEIKSNFKKELSTSPRFNYWECIVGDDLFKQPLCGEYVLLNSDILEIALVMPHSDGTTKDLRQQVGREKTVINHFMDADTIDKVKTIITQYKFGEPNVISQVEEKLNEKLGKRWTVYATFEQDAPLQGVAKPGEFIHFKFSNLHVLVAYHPLTLSEAFEDLTASDIVINDVGGDKAKGYIRDGFKELLAAKLKGKTSEESVVQVVKELFPKEDNQFKLVVLFGHTVTKPTEHEFIYITIKRRNLVILF